MTAFQRQYQRTIEVRRHNAEIHDRAVVIDDSEFYALGASIKDMGLKLSVINRLEDAESIGRLGKELSRIWASAQPADRNGLGLSHDEVMKDVGNFERLLTLLPDVPAI